MITTLLLVLALLLFVLTALGVASRINLTAAGLAALTLSFLLRGFVIQ